MYKEVVFCRSVLLASIVVLPLLVHLVSLIKLYGFL